MTLNIRNVMSILSFRTSNSLISHYNTNVSNVYARKFFSTQLKNKNVLFKRKLLTSQPTPSPPQSIWSRLSTEASLTETTKPEQLTDTKEKTLSAQTSRKVVSERSYFDTHEFVMSLMSKGFTQAQAEQLCFLFKDIVNYIAHDIKKECVSKPGQDLAIQQVMIHIGSLKKDMIILEKSEFYALRNENQKLQMDIKSLREQLNDEVVKLKGSFTLDINLEKNRANEMTYEVTNRVHRLDSRIDSEISNVKALLEAFKAETVRYIAGSMFTGMVIILGALRYFSS